MENQSFLRNCSASQDKRKFSDLAFILLGGVLQSLVSAVVITWIKDRLVKMSDSTDVIPFGTVDYVVFSAMLAISASTGIYHCLAGGGQQSTSQFLVANRSLGCIPIAMSMFVTFTSSIAVMGFPAEMFLHGIQYAFYVINYVWAYAFSAYFFIPVFRSIDITSVYEYMGLRYHLSLRVTCTIIFILQTLLYMATTMVGPALAIEAVQGFEMWKTVLITGTVATFYTTLGGMKAVIWADVFQFLVIFGSVLAVAILGTSVVGGLENVWKYNDVDDRLKLVDFTFDPTHRVSFWGLMGMGIANMGVTVLQSAVQRFLAAKSLSHARGSLLLNIPFYLVIFPIIFFNGLVLYAFYNNKQTSLMPAINSTFPPLASDSGEAIRYEPNYSTGDQILMYFVSSQFGQIPGMQGLFVACLFAGALSTISSGLNAIVACILQDIIKPWRQWRSERTKIKRRENDAWDTKMAKIMNLVFGVLSTLVGFLVPFLGSFVAISSILTGVFGGPILAVFIMGMFLPRTNSWGAFIGLVAGFGLGVFISSGPIIEEQLGVEPFQIQQTSFMLYATVNFSTALIVGVVVSEVARCLDPSLIKKVDPSLLVIALRPKHSREDEDSLIEQDEDALKECEMFGSGRPEKSD